MHNYLISNNLTTICKLVYTFFKYNYKKLYSNIFIFCRVNCKPVYTLSLTLCFAFV